MNSLCNDDVVPHQEEHCADGDEDYATKGNNVLESEMNYKRLAASLKRPTIHRGTSEPLYSMLKEPSGVSPGDDPSFS